MKKIKFEDIFNSAKKEQLKNIIDMTKKDKLIQSQKEYIEFLDNASKTPYDIALVHGYKFPDEIVQEGINRRKEIEELENGIKERRRV